MVKTERQVRARWTYHGFGFPVRLERVPMRRFRGEWIADLDFAALEREVLAALARQRGPLTGDQVRFVRHSLDLTLQAFAEIFNVTHPAVMRWESAGTRPTGMGWGTEKDLRLHILERLGTPAATFFELYKSLRERRADAHGHLIVQVKDAPLGRIPTKALKQG
jgi:DNA-binding transcriptional regulator YiaG